MPPAAAHSQSKVPSAAQLRYGSSSSNKRSPSMPGWSRQVAMTAAAAESSMFDVVTPEDREAAGSDSRAPRPGPPRLIPDPNWVVGSRPRRGCLASIKAMASPAVKAVTWRWATLLGRLPHSPRWICASTIGNAGISLAGIAPPPAARRRADGPAAQWRATPTARPRPTAPACRRRDRGNAEDPWPAPDARSAAPGPWDIIRGCARPRRGENRNRRA